MGGRDMEIQSTFPMYCDTIPEEVCLPDYLEMDRSYP